MACAQTQSPLQPSAGTARPAGKGLYLGGGFIRPIGESPVKFQPAEGHQLPIRALYAAPKHGKATPCFWLGLSGALSEGLDLAGLCEALVYVLRPGIEAFLEV